MKEVLKSILKKIGAYHTLQSGYRKVVSDFAGMRYRFKFRKYKGEGYVCNYCGNIYKYFADDHPPEKYRHAIESNEVIAGYGNNIICPGCMSTARERLVLAMLSTKFHIEGKRVLHLSPEKKILSVLTPECEVITADLEPGFYRKVDRNIQQADATRLSFPDHKFDLVIANHVMEHIPDDRKAMHEIFRVLKPGGQAILQVPYSRKISTIENPGICDPEEQARLFGQKDHVRIYCLADYIQRLEETGFVVEEITYEQLAPFYKNAIQKHESFLMISRPGIEIL